MFIPQIVYRFFYFAFKFAKYLLFANNRKYFNGDVKTPVIYYMCFSNGRCNLLNVNTLFWNTIFESDANNTGMLTSLMKLSILPHGYNSSSIE